MLKHLRVILFWVFWSGGALAEPLGVGSGDETYIEPPPWEEGQVSLPDYPQDSDLLEFPVDGPSTGLRFYVDAKSLSVGAEDDVVRYTVVMVSDAGARNVFHEGMRCDAQQYKTYAYGTGAGKLAPARDPEWRDLGARDPTRYRNELYREYLCALERPVQPRLVVRHLKYRAPELNILDD